MNPQQWKFALAALRLQQTIPVKQSLFTATLQNQSNSVNQVMQYSTGLYVCSSAVVFERVDKELSDPEPHSSRF